MIAEKPGKMETRPWGSFEILHEDNICKVKRIVVNTKQRLSFQMHRRRDEAWTIVKGTGEVWFSPFNPENHVTDEAIPGSYFLIPSNYWHRIINTGDEPLMFIEVQTGTYFGEDDIVRCQDDYGRK